MTRRIPLLACVALVGTILLILSCSKAPTAPGNSAVTQIPGTQTSKASPTWSSGSTTVAQSIPCECLGEDVLLQGTYAFQYHFVESASGTFHMLWQPTPDASLRAETAQSHKIFTSIAAPVVQTVNLGFGIQEVTTVDREIYAADDGSKLLVTYQLHSTTDGSGHLIVKKLEPWSVACLK